MSLPDVCLGSLFAYRATVGPNRRALTYAGSSLSYGQMLDRIERLAFALAEGGVGPGDRVAFLDLNHPSFAETLYATSLLGAVFVPLNHRLAAPELEFIIGDAGVHTLVAGPDHITVIDRIRPSLAVERFVARSDGRDWESYDQLVESPRLANRPPVDPDDVALIMYTSGTTGYPKGAMLTHANLWWHNINHLELIGINADDVTLAVAPLFHIGGLNITTLMTWQLGGEVVVQRAFDAGETLAAIARHQVTSLFGVPTMFLAMSHHPGFADADLSSIRILACGGAPVPEPLLRAYAARGLPMSQGYGLTEAAPGVSFLTGEHALTKIGSAGTAPTYSEVRLVQPDGTVVGDAGVSGEICVRGPNVMKGYWNRPDATAAAIDPEGWLRTGDVGFFDEDGFLFVADRVKDMVISGGENVYPAEVEEVLLDHPAITEVAVIGLPHEAWGEGVTAIATLAPGTSLDLDELRSFADGRLARYKLPIRLEVVDEIPHNGAGKVIKRVLREQFT